ncbi:MAG TPA: L,D-transpeptidase family protein [Solirubrobacteraceae bacterium]|jgi:peptidoglycan hydrolase-like protein with peptidoglycan-binding domain|nr:L,D-transpeptidase family protein [Solirubrobacteraceae bacterium]
MRRENTRDRANGLSCGRRVAVLLSALAALGAAVALPAGALAATTPIAPGAAPTGPAPGAMKLALQHVSGRPLFSVVGRRIVVKGSVTPYVAGQTIVVGFYLEGRKVATDPVGVQPAGSTGKFRVSFSSHYAGLLQARAVHAATAQQAAFTARSPDVRLVHTNLGPGVRNQSVRLLQSELDALHYAVPLTGVFDEGTGQALIAYRKMVGLERIAYAGSQVFARLARGEGGFHVRYRQDGRHVEADLTKQVLAEIEPGGRVYRIYTTSSGKPSTPTVIGRFRVYEKTPGENSEGMVDSNYFIRGYAIHGYAEVPTYAASHGCLRVPIPDAPSIYAWVREGTPVDVYNEDGGGSSRVSANAGP